MNARILTRDEHRITPESDTDHTVMLALIDTEDERLDQSEEAPV